MSKPQRIQLSRKKGWRMPPNTVKVDRSTKWGNPFIVGKHGTHTECVDDFRLMVTHGLICGSVDAECNAAQHEYHMLAIGELRGKNLACWCRMDVPCHADTLLEVANL